MVIPAIEKDAPPENPRPRRVRIAHIPAVIDIDDAISAILSDPLTIKNTASMHSTKQIENGKIIGARFDGLTSKRTATLIPIARNSR
jgi:hypothetical protein